LVEVAVLGESVSSLPPGKTAGEKNNLFAKLLGQPAHYLLCNQASASIART